jgi:hypothetical protein
MAGEAFSSPQPPCNNSSAMHIAHGIHVHVHGCCKTCNGLVSTLQLQKGTCKQRQASRDRQAETCKQRHASREMRTSVFLQVHDANNGVGGGANFVLSTVSIRGSSFVNGAAHRGGASSFKHCNLTMEDNEVIGNGLKAVS